MSAAKPYRIVIVGGGTAGWMTAAALSRFVPPHYNIDLIESDAIGTVGVGEATIPQIHLFNAALGLDEADFVRETKASFKLGIEFAGWGAAGESYMHAFGAIGRPLGMLPFQHYWTRAHKAGFAKPLQRYSMNELAARTMRMQRGKTRDGGPELPYAYHFDAGLYAAFLRSYAEARGVIRHEGLVSDTLLSPNSGDIASLSLQDGRVIEGDFFIDCSGFQGLLIEKALKTGYDDWSHWLPCDRAMAVPCEASGDFTPYTRSTARQSGWQWRIPLQHRIGNGHVYCSRHISDDEAAAVLMANLDGKPLADPRPLKFVTGKRRKFWNRNCLAVGLSSGFMEPLESTSIHLIQSVISRFLAVLPGGPASHSVIDDFNRRSDFEFERIRDFIILHYWANQRIGEPFWDEMRSMALPESLSAKIEQYKACAFIHREHEELFTEVGWFQVLAGQGIIPDGWNPLADSVSDADLAGWLEQIESDCINEVRGLPRHADVVQQLVAIRQPQSQGQAA